MFALVLRVNFRFRITNRRNAMTEITQPTPGDVRSLLDESGLSREQFAELVHVSKLTIHKWVLPVENQNHRGIPLAAWELLLLKLGKHPTKKLIDA